MAICVYGILINVLDFATYQYPGNTNGEVTKSQQEEMIKYDINALSPEEREGCTYTRGQALEIMDVAAQHFTFRDEDDRSKWPTVKSYQESMILHQCQMLFNYKARTTTKSKTLGAPGCNPVLLKEQLSGVLDGEMNIKIKSCLKPGSLCNMTLPLVHSGLMALDDPPPVSVQGQPYTHPMMYDVLPFR